MLIHNKGSLVRFNVSPESPGLADALTGDVALSDVVVDAGAFDLVCGLNLAACERTLQNEPGAELTLRQALKPTARRYRENLYRMRTPTMTPAPSNVRPRLRGF